MLVSVFRNFLTNFLPISSGHFAKCMILTVIVADNGKSGFNGEHSCMDGTPTSRLNDWMLRALKTEKIELGSPTPSAHLSQPKQITFKLNDRMKQHISEANSALDKIRSQHQMVTLNYEGYGKNAIKKFKTSPDVCSLFSSVQVVCKA